MASSKAYTYVVGAWFSLFLLLSVPGFGATPEHDVTIRGITACNLTSSYAVITFIASEPVVGVVNYGTNPKKLTMTAKDESMRPTGVVYIPIYDLEAKTTYYYTIRVYNNRTAATFDNNGALYSFITTNEVTGTPFTIHGKVFYQNEEGAKDILPGAIVYLTVRHGKEESLPLAELSDDMDGSYALSLGNLRSKDGNEFGISEGDVIVIKGDGGAFGSDEREITYTGWDTFEQNLVLHPGERPGTGIGGGPTPTTEEDKNNVERQSLMLLVLVILVVVIGIIVRAYFTASKKKGP